MNDKNTEEKVRLIAERNKRLDIIKNIPVNRANFEYIAESGSINGSLMLDIEIAMDKYQQNTLTKYKVALREAIEFIEIFNRSELDSSMFNDTADLFIAESKQLLKDE